MPGENGVISGMRTSCSVYIELDVEKCLADGIEIFKSKNGVILSRGIDGVIKPVKMNCLKKISYLLIIGIFQESFEES